jgi:hypothetical protein
MIRVSLSDERCPVCGDRPPCKLGTCVHRSHCSCRTEARCIACDIPFTPDSAPPGAHPVAMRTAPDGAYVVQLCSRCRTLAKVRMLFPRRPELYPDAPELDQDAEAETIPVPPPRDAS